MQTRRWIGRTFVTAVAFAIVTIPAVASGPSIGVTSDTVHHTLFARLWQSMEELWCSLGTIGGSEGAMDTPGSASPTVGKAHAGHGVSPPDDGPIGETNTYPPGHGGGDPDPDGPDG